MTVGTIDFVHDQPNYDRSQRLLNVINDFYLKSPGIEVGFWLPAERVIRCDKGIEYISDELSPWAKKREGKPAAYLAWPIPAECIYRNLQPNCTLRLGGTVSVQQHRRGPGLRHALALALQSRANRYWTRRSYSSTEIRHDGTRSTFRPGKMEGAPR